MSHLDRAARADDAVIAAHPSEVAGFAIVNVLDALDSEAGHSDKGKEDNVANRLKRLPLRPGSPSGTGGV